MQPWHIRRCDHQDNLWFGRIIDLHAITIHWIKDLDFQASMTHQLVRALSPKTQERLSAIESLIPSPENARLEDFLEEQHPDEFLQRLQEIVLTVQAWVLRRILETSAETERDPIRNLLEQSSWKSGRKCAQIRWGLIPDAQRRDLRAVLDCLEASIPGVAAPIARPRRHFLIRRQVMDEMELELLSCPHRWNKPELIPVVDDLCRLRFHWTRGFLYGIHSQLTAEQTSPDPQTSTPTAHSGARCVQRWVFSNLR